MSKGKEQGNQFLRSKISIKWSIFGYLLIFTFILLAILWVFQTVYLDKFYKGIKERELGQAISKIAEKINDRNYKEVFDDIAKKYDIRIIQANEDGTRVYATGSAATESISKLDSGQIKKLYQMARENDGEVQISSKNGLLEEKGEKKDDIDVGRINAANAQKGQDRQQGTQNEEKQGNGQGTDRQWETPQMPTASDGSGDWMHGGDNIFQMFDIPKGSQMETMMVAKIVVTEKNQEYLMIADSVITPVTATVYAIRIQLIYISFIMIVLSLFMAIIISFHISKPIIRINHTAKKISEGNFNIEFDRKGYKEIAQMSETLNYTVEELTRSEQLQRELIANVSHDLRTPLTMITAYAEVMRDIPGENTPENVQVVIDEATRLTNLVNDLLDISKLQAGVTKPDMKIYNLTAGIRSVMERYAKLKEQDGYSIEFVQDEGDVWVEADEFKIYQVMYNLVNNAVNYTGKDKKVSVRQITRGDIVRIEVKDSGEGIPEAELENVWDRYYKVDKTHKRAIMGTGLGLSIVKSILILHNAKYGVTSREGHGSTFWFELKIADK